MARGRRIRVKRKRSSRPRVVTVFGTRPQFVKLSVLWRLLEERFESILVDSGQHYDHALAGAFHQDTGLRLPDHHLGVGSAPTSVQIARVAERLDRLLRRLTPDAVCVFGDTSTTAGAAIAASYRNIPLAHIEAGLRSGDANSPEEKNRTLTDHLSHWLFVPTESATANLNNEGITRGVVGVGDVMHEQWRLWRSHIDLSAVLAEYGVETGRYYFMTCHRAETVDDHDRLARVLAICESLSHPTIWSMHPRTRASLTRHRLRNRLKRNRLLRVLPPIPYPDSLGLSSSARAVITDSGGLQREACWCETPCLVLRERTEWHELVEARRVRLIGLDTDRLQGALRRRWTPLPIHDRFARVRCPSRRIVNRLTRELN